MFSARHSFAALLVAGLAAAGGASAQEETPERIAQEKDWGAYEVDGGDGKVCYVLSRPRSSEPSGVNRDDAYFFVTTRPQEDTRNQVSVVIGYPFKPESEATVEVGDETFTLFTNDNKAFIDNLAEQDKLVAAMRAGLTMTVKGTSARGTETTDTYSLSGITAALGHIDQACP